MTDSLLQNNEEQTKNIREGLARKYKERGFQQISLAEYEAIKKRKARSLNYRLPPSLAVVLGTPFLIIFCFGIFFIPYIIYQIATGRPAPEKKVNGLKASISQEIVAQERR
jgi:hypothetical protein